MNHLMQILRATARNVLTWVGTMSLIVGVWLLWVTPGLALIDPATGKLTDLGAFALFLGIVAVLLLLLRLDRALTEGRIPTRFLPGPYRRFYDELRADSEKGDHR